MSRLLLVDAYPRSLNVLGVSLRQSGYDVTTAGDGVQALAEIASAAPHLVITATRLPKLDGYEVVRKLRELPQTATTPVIFVASPQDSAEDRSRARELGVDDYLERPVFVRELVARVQLLLARHAQEYVMASPKLGCTRLGGSTRHLAVVDLVQLFETSGKSGVVHLRTGAQEAHLYFRDGRVIDAELGPLRGEEAVYRAFVWYDAAFDVELKPVTNEDLIGCSTQTIVRKGMHRVSEWLTPALAPVDPPVNSRPSSAPWTREMRPGADSAHGDIVSLAGVPRAGRTTKRVVATVVAAAAVLAVAGGLRAMHPLRLQTHEAQAQSVPVVAAAPPVGTEEAVAPASVAEPAATVEVPDSGEPVQSTTASYEVSPSLNAPLPPAVESTASAAAVAPAGKETAIDTELTSDKQAPLVGDAQRALLMGDTGRALSLAQKAVVANPTDADGWLTLAAAQKASGNVAGAAEAYHNCISRARTAGVNDCRSLGSKP